MIIGNKVRLRNKRLADARDDYRWQTDPELVRLDAVPLLTIAFAQYLSEYSSELRNPSSGRHQFAVETVEGEHIGNCVYYGIDETKGEAELGIMIGKRDYWDKGYGADTVTTLVDHVFRQTGLRRIYLKTLDSNVRALKCFEKCGFTPCGQMVKDGFSFELMEIRRGQWGKRQTEA